MINIFKAPYHKFLKQAELYLETEFKAQRELLKQVIW